MNDCMTFPDTVEEFMDDYKIIDTEGIYMSKGTELVPIFRMNQWFEHSEPSQLAKDIARILKNDQDMRVILKNAESEIVRCKNCKYRDENWRRVSVRWLPCMEVRTGSNWYCGSAERRQDAD